jgi:hypothetical protein
MVKVMLLDVSAKVPPPYIPPAVPGFVTVTVTEPEVAMAEAGIEADTWVPTGPEVVVSAVPFQLMTALAARLVPLTVSVNAAPPAFVLSGVSVVIAGVVPATGAVVAFEL